MTLTENQKQEIERLFHAGFGAGSICAKTRIGSWSVNQHLKSRGLHRSKREAHDAMRDGIRSGVRPKTHRYWGSGVKHKDGHT